MITLQNPDPYPSIPPALLNSGDIRAYAEHPKVKFISPFVVDRLKSASYHVPCEGTVFAWETVEGAIPGFKKIEFELTEGKSFTLKPNSIVYLFTSTVFRLPKYLAMRFNLTIAKVHQGLLLGTGPLVDPGFEGRLLIPLHNLTNQGVELHADEMLMWIEVTKLSPEQLELDRPAHSFKSVPFPENKKNLPASYYFRQANQGRPVLSSVQTTLDESRSLNETLKRYTTWGAGATIIGVLALIYSSYQVVQAAHGKFDGLTEKALEQKQVLDDYKSRLERLQREVDSLRSALSKRGVAGESGSAMPAKK